MLKTRNFNVTCDIVQNGFAPPNRNLADFSVIKKDDEFHLFYIDSNPGISCVIPGNETYFGHAITKDFKIFKILGPALTAKEGTWEGGHLWAPYVIKAQDHYWMFYTGLTETLSQSIGAAVSSDLLAWRRIQCNPLFRPNNIPHVRWSPLEGACRDPHVFFCDDVYYLYTTVDVEGHELQDNIIPEGHYVEDDPDMLGGCGIKGLACSTSKDLIQWTYCGLAHVRYRATNGITCIESSWVSKEGSKYLLVFGHSLGLYYAFSDNPKKFQSASFLKGSEGLTGIELIANNSNKRLVAAFTNGREGYQVRRLVLGILTLSENKPAEDELRLDLLVDYSQLDEFGFAEHNSPD
jgi:hypothetical protein